MVLNIREYTKGDLEKHILPLDRANMRNYFNKHLSGGWSDKESTRLFYDLIDNDGIVKIFEENKEFAGYTLFNPRVRDKETVIFINDLQVKKEFQGKGIGTWALSFIEKKVVEMGYAKTQLYVFEDNSALNLYERLGYQKIDFLEESSTHLMQKILD